MQTRFDADVENEASYEWLAPKLSSNHMKTNQTNKNCLFSGFTSKAWIGVGLVVLVLTAGCASTKLRVYTDPPGSEVTIKQAGSDKKPISGIAPQEVKVRFETPGKSYVIDVSPSPGMTDRFLPSNRAITSSNFALLPVEGRDKTRRLDVKLEEKQFINLLHVEVVLDERRTWRGAVAQSRAFKDINEVGGAAPGRVVDLGENLGIQSMALSPDGQTIVYSLAAHAKSLAELQKIFSEAEVRQVDIIGANLQAVNIMGGGVQHITSENYRDLFPSFTAKGDNLLFTSNRRRSQSEDILEKSALERTGISDVLVDARGARLLRPTQAKNGIIAFAVEDPNPANSAQRFTIWTMGGPNRFPTQLQLGNQPAISPDGTRIAYIGADGNVWVVNTDGSRATQLTFGSDKIVERYRSSLSPEELRRYDWFVTEFGMPEKRPFSYPSWSADAQYIVYTGMEGSDPTGRPNEDIWIMRFDGSGRKQLTTNGSSDRYPLMSPDGKLLYFMSNRGGRWAIWRISLELVSGQ